MNKFVSKYGQILLPLITPYGEGEEVNYVETYYLCPNSDEDENEFVTGKMMNDNLLNARNEYRKAHDLLT